MTRLRTAADAAHHTARNRPDARDFQPLTHDGRRVGWTFAVGDAFGWVLTDGRVSPATEPYRSYAADYARLQPDLP